jgi:hypothetical protein
MPRFTTANAREMAARSQAARRQREMQRQATSAMAAATPQPNPRPGDNDQFVTKRLARVRKQLDRIDGLIEKETDPMKLDRLASAQARIAEQERLLAGRPLPGSRKPGKDHRTVSPHDLPMPDPVSRCVAKPVDLNAAA